MGKLDMFTPYQDFLSISVYVDAEQEILRSLSGCGCRCVGSYELDKDNRDLRGQQPGNMRWSKGRDRSR